LVHDALKVALGLDSLAGAENFTGYALVLRLTGAEWMNVSARDAVGSRGTSEAGKKPGPDVRFHH